MGLFCPSNLTERTNRPSPGPFSKYFRVGKQLGFRRAFAVLQDLWGSKPLLAIDLLALERGSGPTNKVDRSKRRAFEKGQRQSTDVNRKNRCSGALNRSGCAPPLGCVRPITLPSEEETTEQVLRNFT